MNRIKQIIVIIGILFTSTVSLYSQSCVYYCRETGAAGWAYGSDNCCEVAREECIKAGGKSPEIVISSRSSGYGAIYFGTSADGRDIVGASAGYPSLEEAKEVAKSECIQRGGQNVFYKDDWYVEEINNSTNNTTSEDNKSTQSCVYYCKETGAAGWAAGYSNSCELARNTCINYGGKYPEMILSSNSAGYGAIYFGTTSDGLDVIGASAGYATLEEAKEAAKSECISGGGHNVFYKDHWHIEGENNDNNNSDNSQNNDNQTNEVLGNPFIGTWVTTMEVDGVGPVKVEYIYKSDLTCKSSIYMNIEGQEHIKSFEFTYSYDKKNLKMFNPLTNVENSITYRFEGNKLIFHENTPNPLILIRQ